MSVAYLWVALGGALGSMLRFGISEWMVARLGPAFPWGTLTVNVVGSFLIGLLSSLAAVDGPRLFAGTDVRAFLMVGLCGGFTTFSTFSLQTLSLIQEGAWLAVGLNIFGSLALCLAAVWVGYSVGMAGR